MATKKPALITRTILIKPREVFKNQILDRISKGEELFNREIRTHEQLEQINKDFYIWNDFNKELFKQSFNKPDNEYYYSYSRVNSMLGFLDYTRGVDTDHPQYQMSQSKLQIENCLTKLKLMIEKSELIDEDESIKNYIIKDKVFFNKGFIVHGHDDSRKFEVARYIENDLRRKTIILHEQPNKGRTIMEKFEAHSSVDFAVALWTADDDGKSKKEVELKDRARQNVIFETGFFIGKLGRSNVIVLYENDVEIPSDYSGVIFIPFSGNWKDDLRKEIEAIYQL
jgi:predicted nucleotide-binding protein